MIDATATPDALADMERALAEGRDTMTLTERINARRAIDAAAGVTYTEPIPGQVHKLARVMHTGMRRLRTTD